MAEHGIDDEPVPELDSAGSVGSAQVEKATADDTAALLRRVTVLEDRERALNAELAALRADLGNLRQHLHQARIVEGLTEVVDSPTVGESGPPATRVEDPIDSTDGEAFLVDGTSVDEAKDERVHGPLSSDIDDLIQAAVTSRGRDLESSVRPPDAAIFPEVEMAADPPTAADVETPTAAETKIPTETSADDFFIGQSSPRRGRS